VPSQFTKVIIGALVLLSTFALLGPIFYPGETETGKPRDITHYQNSVNKDNQESQTQNSDEEISESSLSVKNSENASNLDNFNEYSEGYGDLLEEDGAQAPADFGDEYVKSGLDVGIEQTDFPTNPTVMGNTPAEVAKNRKETVGGKGTINTSSDEDSYALRSNKNEVKEVKEVKSVKTTTAKVETASETNANSKSKELEQVKKQTTSKTQIAQETVDTVKTVEQPKKVVTETPKVGKVLRLKSLQPNNTATPKAATTSKSYYVKAGAFSTQANANKRKQEIQKARLRIKKTEVGNNFRISIEKNNGLYHVMLGPILSDSASDRIRKDIERATNSKATIIQK
jgi:cell division protein FtsN